MSIQTLQLARATFPRRSSTVNAFARTSSSSVCVLQTLAGVESVAEEWAELEAATPEATGFQSVAWCLAWIRASNNDDPGRWRVVTVRDNGRLVCVLPLERTVLFGARLVKWLGEPWTQYGDVLVANDARRTAYLAAAWNEVRRWSDVDLVKFSRVRADAALSALPGFGDHIIVGKDTAPFVDLRRRAPAGDKRLRARRKKLAASGDVRFDIVTDPSERAACVETAVAMKRQWLRSRGLASSGLFHPTLEPLMKGLASSDELVIGRLRVGDKIAALELGLAAHGCFRSLLGAHDEQYASGSPGHLLIADMNGWCRTIGHSTYDLMVPADAYKLRWADGTTEVTDRLIVTGLRGRGAAAWLRARPTAKRLFARLPNRVRQSLAAAHNR